MPLFPLNIISTIPSRFHYSKALFSKIKGKFGLAGYFRAQNNREQAMISHTLRQYLALPLLTSEDMRVQVKRLERDLKKRTRNCTPYIISCFNKFHQYVVKYWMKFHGPENITVFDAQYKTNNIVERY